MAELEWGILLVAYLFIGGMAGGSFIVAALSDLFGRGRYRVLSKSGTYVSFVAIAMGLVLLILDLGRFEVDPLVPLNAYVNFPTSIMSFGTWIVTGFIVVSLLTSVLWFFHGSVLIRKLLEVAGIVLGGGVASYTGLLLSFARGRPFWATPYLPWIFVISGSLTGLAMALFLIPIIAKLMPRFFEEFKELFENKREFAAMLRSSQRYVVALITLELVLVAVEVAMSRMYSELQLAGSSLQLMFIGYVVVGLIMPLGIGYYTGKGDASSDNEGLVIFSSILGMILILIGGFLLRYVILMAGQLIA